MLKPEIVVYGRKLAYSMAFAALIALGLTWLAGWKIGVIITLVWLANIVFHGIIAEWLRGRGLIGSATPQKKHPIYLNDHLNMSENRSQASPQLTLSEVKGERE